MYEYTSPEKDHRNPCSQSGIYVLGETQYVLKMVRTTDSLQLTNIGPIVKWEYGGGKKKSD